MTPKNPRPRATTASHLIGGALRLGLGLLLATGSRRTRRRSATRRPNCRRRKPVPAAPTKMVLEPRAMDLLKAAAARLAAAKSMAFTATVSYEYPSQLGPPILYTVRYDVAMQRPDKLQVIIPGDGPASEFYYDGKSITAYAPSRESGRRRRRPADDRRRPQARLRRRRHLSIRSPTCWSPIPMPP